jgi:hypothetical protein
MLFDFDRNRWRWRNSELLWWTEQFAFVWLSVTNHIVIKFVLIVRTEDLSDSWTSTWANLLFIPRVWVQLHPTLLTLAYCEINPLNAKLNLICHLLALLGAHHIIHVSRIKVKNEGRAKHFAFLFTSYCFIEWELFHYPERYFTILH